MDQNPNQAQPENNQQGPGEAPQQPSYGVPAGDPSQYPSGPPPYAPYGSPQQYPPYGPPQQYPPYGPPAGAPPYPPYPPYPYPGYAPVQPAQKSSKLWLWVLLGIIGFSLIACLVAVGLAFTAIAPSVNSSVQQQDASATTVATPENGNNNGTPANIKTVAIGQPVTIQSVACTLVSVKHVAGDSTAQPQQGDEFIVVDIKLSNQSGQVQQYNTFDFYVANSAGRASLNSNVVPKAYQQQLSGGTLMPGKSTEGKLVFEVASSDHQQTLNWQPSFTVSPQDSNIGAWKLGL